MTEERAPTLALPPDSLIAAKLTELAGTQRMVFFAGLPGVGKSLLIRELANIAHGLGRRVHLLQWDIARQSFVTNAVLAKYPDVHDVTHAVIRKAMGVWSRRAVAAWYADNPDGVVLLIGETPLIGNRFIELAAPGNDEAEPLLTSAEAAFLVPVPSKVVRQAIEGAREATTITPKHEREGGDARPSVMHAIWNELLETAATMGISNPSDGNYDPETYQAVYAAVLKHRRCEVLPIDITLAPNNRSVYDLAVPYQDVMPTAAEGEAFIAQVEKAYPDQAVLDEEVARWYAV
jgi:hypothetical protein